MLIPQLVLAMADYLNATEALADATEDLLKAEDDRRAGLLGNTIVAREAVLIRLKVYRLARHNWENLQ